MGNVATVTIGLLPDAGVIGVAAPIILVLLRFLQASPSVANGPAPR